MPRNTLQLGLIYPREDQETVEAERQRAESLGIFEVTQPGEVNPDVGPEDFIPSEEDYVRVPFRLLSETIVAAYTTRATDFSEAGLQNSMQKLVGKTVFAEHEGYVGNQLGVIEDVEWQDSRTVDGVNIPAGIKGTLKLDAKANPKTVRSLLADPPEIYSASVTIDFHWEPSHSLEAFESIFDFENNIGKIDEESGRMITRKVTDVVDYYEVSLIHLGADPFAKILTEDENPHNIDMSRVRDEEGFSVGDMSGNELRALHSANSFRALHSFRLDKYPNGAEKPKNESSMNRDAFKALIGLLGYSDENSALEAFGISSAEELTSDQLSKFRLTSSSEEGGGNSQKVEDLEKDLQTKKDRIEELRQETDRLQKESRSRKEEAEKLTAIKDSVKKELGIESEENFTANEVSEQLHSLRLRAEAHDERVEKLRKETLDLYKKTVEEKDQDQEMLDLIDKADPKKLQSLAKTFGASTSEKFTSTCNECGSQNVSLRSTQENSEEEGESEGRALTLDELREKHQNDKMFPGKEENPQN